MPLQIDLRGYFSPEAVAHTIQTQPVIHTQVMDLIYPNRITHPLPVLGYDEIQEVTGNVPMVLRGAPAYPLSGGSLDINFLNPQPVEVSSFVNATEFNNLKMLNKQGVQFWVNGKIDRQRRTVRATSEALSIQSLSGAISYPMLVPGGGLATYEVSFGTPLSVTLAVLLDADTANLAMVLELLIALAEKIQDESGYGADVIYLAGKKVFITLAKLVIAAGNAKIEGKVTENTVSIAGFSVQLARGGYRNLTNNTWVPAVADKDLVAVAKDAPHRFYYVAIDDLDADLQPLPLFVKTIKKDNPSGYEIIGKSKPVPVPVPKAICKVTAVS